MTDPNARGFAHTREQFQQLVEDALALARTLGASEAGVEVSEGVSSTVMFDGVMPGLLPPSGPGPMGPPMPAPGGSNCSPRMLA